MGEDAITGLMFADDFVGLSEAPEGLQPEGLQPEGLQKHIEKSTRVHEGMESDTVNEREKQRSTS